MREAQMREGWAVGRITTGERLTPEQVPGKHLALPDFALPNAQPRASKSATQAQIPSVSPPDSTLQDVAYLHGMKLLAPARLVSLRIQGSGDHSQTKPLGSHVSHLGYKISVLLAGLL